MNNLIVCLPIFLMDLMGIIQFLVGKAQDHKEPIWASIMDISIGQSTCRQTELKLSYSLAVEF